jgi:hypothetical protein
MTAKSTSCTIASSARPAYLQALNDYFREQPYRGWFDVSFEPLLEGLGASYYGGAKSTAIHTDLCSPLATDPTWSRLSRAEQEALIIGGNPLWHELVELVQPDVVLISVKREHLAKIRFPVVDDLGTVHVVERERPYRIEGARRELASGKRPLFVFGKAAQKPFSLISGPAKRAAGAALLGLVDPSSTLLRPVHPSRQRALAQDADRRGPGT